MEEYFSCDIHITKPSSKIYHYFLKAYKLSPKNCLFFDDVQENVEAAQKEGINSVLFTSVECVKPFIREPI